MRKDPEFSCSALLEDLEGERKLLEAILGDFYEEYSLLQERFKRAFRCGEREELSLMAHSMKSGLGALGWTEGVEMADRIHRACDRESWDEVVPLVEEFEPVLDCFLRKVEASRISIVSDAGEGV